MNNKSESNIIKKAENNLEAASYLRNLGITYTDSAANRLYYAVFCYPYQILMRKKLLCDQTSGKHYIVKDFLIKNIDKRIFKIFNDIYKLRITADYEYQSVDYQILEKSMNEAAKFIKYMKENIRLLVQSNYIPPKVR
ncbi:MAG: HEPN domain-containing protein [Desulfobacteraceae bacterium]|nr:HEPN domain-containing protein [Desulfobacteraceae bacterium]